MSKYKWYWRIECVNSPFFFHNLYFILIFHLFRPHVQFHCDILYDPFKFMEENKKIYCMKLFFSLMSLRSLLILKSL